MNKLTALLNWVDERFPLTANWKSHLSEYYAPKNFNFWYFFGSLAMLILVIQIVTGILLTMHYKPDASQAFASVEYIMRDVPWGWLIRYMHSTGDQRQGRRRPVGDRRRRYRPPRPRGRSAVVGCGRA